MTRRTQNYRLSEAAATGQTNTAVTTLAVVLSLYIAAFDNPWSLPGSPRKGQASLYLLSKTFELLEVRSLLSSMRTSLNWVEHAGVFALSVSALKWGVHVLRSPNFFSGMEADRNVKVVGGDVAVL